MPLLSDAAVAATLQAIRASAPLVHNVTNMVVANSTANALLAIGASPAMVEDPCEVEDFVVKADALVVNLGTMSARRAQASRRAARAAMRAGRPWALDPVAAGAVPRRLALACELLAFRPAVIRGNGSEIMALSGARDPGGRGVDSAGAADTARAAAATLARDSTSVVAVTGATDYITDGVRHVACGNGDALMTRVTGLGCTATAMVGACLAVQPDALIAASHALALLGVAGESAASRSRGPGSLQLELLDALHRLDAAALAGRVRLRWVA